MTHRRRAVVAIAAIVLVLHAAALWALNAGLTARTSDTVAPAPMLARIVALPAPSAPAPQPVATQPALEPRPALPVQTPRLPKPAAMQVAPQPAMPRPASTMPAATPVYAPPPGLSQAPTPAPAEPATTPIMPATNPAPGAGKTASSRPATEPAPAPSGQVAAAVATPVGPMPVELPSSDAQYLQNPRPRYPPISLRLREHGTVLVDVLVSDQGTAQEAKVQTSSGFFRLDNAAVSTVLTWRFVPGKRAGVAQSMWFTVPITFAIQ